MAMKDSDTRVKMRSFRTEFTEIDALYDFLGRPSCACADLTIIRVIYMIANYADHEDRR
jgi:hypothetical protein